MVHDLPGTTRDSIDTLVESEDGAIRYVDTAGMRRRSRIDEPTEYYGLVRALESVDRADAALLVIDATSGVTHQDQRLGERIDAAGTAVVIVLNKWDLVTDADERRQVEADVADRLAFLGYAPVLKVSALSGKNVVRVLPALRQAEEAYHTRIPTASLNRLLQEAQTAAPASARASAPPAHPLRDPGCVRPADVHAVRDARARADVSPLPRAPHPRCVRPRTDADQAPRPPPQRLNRSTDRVLRAASLRDHVDDPGSGVAQLTPEGDIEGGGIDPHWDERRVRGSFTHMLVPPA